MFATSLFCVTTVSIVYNDSWEHPSGGKLIPDDKQVALICKRKLLMCAATVKKQTNKRLDKVIHYYQHFERQTVS